MSDDVALLLRRAGFGPTSRELQAARGAGYDATVTTLTTPPGPDLGATSAPVPQLGPDPFLDLRNPTTTQTQAASAKRQAMTLQMTQWWLDRMTAADHQAVEKLVFFWHGHWATSIGRVGSPPLMLTQHLTLRNSPDFVAMAHAMVRDPALIIWLDGHYNTATAPNENLARELMELFTLGVGHYTEADVKQAARALTGWRIDHRLRSAVLDTARFDPGSKSILGVMAAFSADDLVDLLVRQPACPRFIATRLWFRYASSSQPVPDSVLARMVGAFPAPLAMLGALFSDPAFQTTAGTLVKQPIEWLVGAMRQLSIRPGGIAAATFADMVAKLEIMGQRPFAPPNVGGWPSGAAWLTSAAALVRLRLARTLADLAAVGRNTPENVAFLLGIDRWSNRTYAVLRGVRDARLLLALGLVSPEYLVT